MRTAVESEDLHLKSCACHQEQAYEEVPRQACKHRLDSGSVSFEMSSGGHDGCSFIPRWNEEAATLEAFEQRVKLFVSSTKKEE